MVVFDRLGPVVKIAAKKVSEGEGEDMVVKYLPDPTKEAILKKSTKHQHAELFSPADLKVIATQTEAVDNDKVWSDPSVGSEAEMLTPPNLTEPEPSLPVTIAEVPAAAIPEQAEDEDNA